MLENYLARYINRIAISKGRFEYLAKEEQVNIIYKEYRKQNDGQPAPLGIKTMRPLVAIDQFLMHVLPPYFQKSRYNGLHASATYKKHKDSIDQKLIKNKDSVASLMSLLLKFLKEPEYKCSKCKSEHFEIQGVTKDKDWIFQFITLPNYRAPPTLAQHRKLILL